MSTKILWPVSLAILAAAAAPGWAQTAAAPAEAPAAPEAAAVAIDNAALRTAAAEVFAPVPAVGTAPAGQAG